MVIVSKKILCDFAVGLPVGFHCKYTDVRGKKSRKMLLQNYVSHHFLLLQNYVKQGLEVGVGTFWVLHGGKRGTSEAGKTRFFV